MLEAADSESQERKENHGDQGHLLQPGPLDICAMQSVLGCSEVCPVPHAWGISFMGRDPLHCPPAPLTSSQRHWGDVGCWCHLPVTFLLLTRSCARSEVPSGFLSPTRRCLSILEEALSPPSLPGALGAVAPACGTHSSGGGSWSHCT